MSALAGTIRLALRALGAHPMRSALTMLGMIVGAGALVVVFAVGAGAQLRVLEQIRSLGGNLIVVLPGAATAGPRRLAVGTATTLTEADAVAIEREIPGVLVASPSVYGNLQVVHGNRNWLSIAQGTTPDYLLAREWPILAGRMFTETELQRGDKVAVLGQTVVRELFGDEDPIDAIVRIRSVPLRVIGVLTRKGQNTQGADQDDKVLLPLTTAKRRVLGARAQRPEAVHYIMVKAAAAELLPGIEQELRLLLRQRHRLAGDQPDDFVFDNLAELQASTAATSGVLTRLLAAVASVALIVGGISIMNTMLVAVAERTREIGLRLAVGARPRDIQQQFLTESVVLALAGGCLGVILGVAIAFGVGQWSQWPTVIEPRVIAAAVVFTALVGAAAGLYPARRAAWIDPYQALRTE